MIHPKPCPFCGSLDSFKTWDLEDRPLIECSDCFAQGPPAAKGNHFLVDSESHVEAIRLWNRRPGLIARILKKVAGLVALQEQPEP